MALPDRRNSLNPPSSDGHQTDPPPPLPQTDLLSVLPSVFPSDRLPEDGGAEGRSEDGGGIKSQWLLPCMFCDKAERDHHCAVAWKWQEPIPIDTGELARYLMTVWEIRYAELIAVEVGAQAIRGALLIVWRGNAAGRRYENPAGLIVKLARRIANAEARAQRRQR